MAFKDLPNDSILKTVIVATTLCLVCSVAVSAAAVFLRPVQEANKAADLQKNIVAVAGVDMQGRSVADVFAGFEARVVDLDKGVFTDAVDPANYDQRKAAKDPAQAEALSGAEDIASIKRREHYATVYIVRDAAGGIERLILPVRGYGLWSTLWGYVALEGDANTVIGLSFYEHAETPGLGGEVDNPAWKALWEGKQIYGDAGKVQVELVKGSHGDDPHKVDALSGATLTSNGVTYLMQFWMGDKGFKPFLNNLREGKA
ncbi:MAG: Na(+)-translocating NADH-quinone reductase subunit C [Oceanococcaceae bacterium]